MKPQTPFFIAILAALFTIPGASAQGEWKWAHCWSGSNGVNTNDYYNRITAAAFDDEGNLYVYGSMGATAAIDNELLAFSEDSRVLLTNNPAILLAKFDTMGNMLWYKVVKQSTQRAVPKWMEVKDDRIFIEGDCGFVGDSHHEWLYYMDTLIEESQITALPDSLQKPPFKRYSCWTFFAVLDLDGNLIDNHFVELFSREYLEPVHLRLNEPLCYYSGTEPTPFHVDDDGNWHVFTPIAYRGVESDPYTVVVYGDTDCVYDLFLPGSIDSSAPANAAYFNAMLYKFSPEWKLLRSKLLINRIENAAPYCANGGDSLIFYTPYFKGLSYDEEDNMYLSGYMMLGKRYPNSGGLLNHYPVYYYWDSTHRLVVHDITSAEYANFIVKYDTSCNMVWCNQIHTKGTILNYSTNVCSSRIVWHGNTYYDHSVYLSGFGGYNNIDNATLIYFDSEENPIQTYSETPTSTGTTTSTDIGFFARFDQATGAYINQGIVPAERVLTTTTPGVSQNIVFIFAQYGYATEQKNLFVKWRNDGTFIKADSVVGPIDPVRSMGVMADKRGHVVSALLSEGNIHFNNSIGTNCPSENNAVIAMYYDPDIVNGIPERENKFLSVKLWPNPTANTLHIGCEETSLEYLSVLDLTGRTVLRQAVDGFHSQIDVSSLPAGMYLLEIVSSGRKQYEKFVKSAE